ncbi:UNVERIFIED_CONTAM: hypothetical protein GTU68_024997 [Idotea baltica]|nr:hypothetical protein [Idotea baltica]
MSQDFSPLPQSATTAVDTPGRIELGKKLYFDPRLSSTGTVSCNTCHNLMEGGDDGRATSMGVSGLTGDRNAPTVWNSVFQSSQFWDGRADTLDAQAKGPLVADVEMGMLGHDHVIQRIKKVPEYVAEFQTVFAEEHSVTIDNAVAAIASFERTLITPNSPFDRYLQGEQTALTAVQKRGMELFESTGCIECHSGPALNGWDEAAQAVYVKRYDLLQDVGREAATKSEGDRHLFKTPTLRNISLTAPYFHNGRVGTLTEACQVMASTQLDTTLTADETSNLVAFLKSLDGEFPEVSLPRIPSRSGESLLVEPMNASPKSLGK